MKKKEDTDNIQNLKMEYKDRAEINKTEYYKISRLRKWKFLSRYIKETSTGLLSLNTYDQ